MKRTGKRQAVHFMDYSGFFTTKYRNQTPCGIKIDGYSAFAYTFYREDVTCPKCQEILRMEVERN